MAEEDNYSTSLTFGQLLDEVERVAKLVPHDCPVIADEDHPRGEGLAFDISGLEVDGVVRVKLI